MSLRTQFKSLLEPELLEDLVNQTISVKICRYPVGQAESIESIALGPLPSWFSIYEMKLALWNLKRLEDGSRDPAFAPPLVFLGIPIKSETDEITHFKPVEMIWLNNLSGAGKKQEVLALALPITLMTGSPDSRFVDSAGGQKALGKDIRSRMTLSDVFQLDEGKTIPELYVFLYSDLIDRISGPRPFGDRDIYGRIFPYFPFLDPEELPEASGVNAITQVLVQQADQTAAALKQILYLEELLQTLGGEFQMPKLDGVKFLRWVWNQKPSEWEGPSVLFFGIKVTHERPFMRFFPASGQPLTKIRVKGLLPIPDVADPNLLLLWRKDKNPDVGKDCTFLKMRIQDDDIEDIPIYSTMRIFNDGTADLLILPPKQKRLLDPYSDLQDAPEILDKCFMDMPYLEQLPTLGQADVIFKIRLKREESQITKALLQKRLKAFSSVFQEIAPLPDEQPLAMLRYKGVSNFTSEDRIFAFLTQIAAHEMVEGDVNEETWVPRVASEFQISMDEARRHVVTWIAQKNEYSLAVPETKDYILSKNPGVDIAIFAQHPIYNFHIYRVQSFQIYTTIVNLLGLLISAPANRFAPKTAAVVAATVARSDLGAPAPVVADLAPAADGIAQNGEGTVDDVFFPDDDDLPEFMRGAQEEVAEEETKEEDAVFPNNDDVPEFMRTAMAAPTNSDEPVPEPVIPITASTSAAAAIPAAIDEEDKKAAEAFKKPTDMKAIKIKNYYISRLTLADPDIFNYKSTVKADRYVTHCQKSDGRQPIVLDKDEFNEMKHIYENDNDLTIIVYPDDSKPAKIPKRQPSKTDNMQGKLDGKAYPDEENKEIITFVKYGSKAKRVNYYFCPRLFCVRDRLLVRYKDFKAPVDRNGLAKPPNTCPFCKGTVIVEPKKDDDKEKEERDPNMTVLERKLRKNNESERHIYIGLLGDGKKKTPSGLSMPCCFADDNHIDLNDPEFVRLGLRAGKAPQTVRLPPTVRPTTAVEAQPIADAIMTLRNEPPATFSDTISQTAYSKEISRYEPNYYRVIQGVSVKSIVDANRIPLEIVVPKASAPEDPKAGPQIGLLPEALDTFFLQDSASDKFADRLEIVRKLKPTAKGFLRLAIDNTVANRSHAFLSALAPYFLEPNADKVIEHILDNHIPPRHFLQLNGGNLVHEFFNKCEKKHQNDMRAWVAKFVGIDDFKSTNIPAIERLMNSYECFKSYIHDPTQRKDLRVFYQALSEPGVILDRGILLIVLEVSVEDTTIKRGDKSEYKRDIKFERIRCPSYPLSKGQQNADIGFLVHYNEVIRERGSDRKTFRNLGWEPLLHVDGNLPTADSRHKPTLIFQRSQYASWPPIVQKRVEEFFYNCVSSNRGPFTSQFGFSPNALIAAQDLITGVRIQPNGIIRDSYNHLVGLAYKIAGKSEYVAVPIADDGLMDFERRLFLDWDDFTPAPADTIIKFYKNNIINIFSQYRGYEPKYLQRSRDTNKIIGVTLQNGFSIPASEAKDPAALSSMRIVDVDDLEWDINRTIAYDTETRRLAFEHAEVTDPQEKEYMKLKLSSIQDEIEDIYQHLRVTFSRWLSTAGSGRDIREALRDVLKRKDLPLYEKRKRLDILLEDKVVQWMEPRDKDDLTSPDEIGFLRVDCLTQGESECSGRCKWISEGTDGPQVCKIHTPATTSHDGTAIHVPRMLYLRLVDELIRYASRREEIFSRQVPRLTIRKEAQRQGDQYIIPEGSPDWNSWWELLRTEWMTPDKETVKFFDEQYEPTPSGLHEDTTRELPEFLKDALSMDDIKTTNLVWNPSDSKDEPYYFLKSILRNSPEITTKNDVVLSDDEISEISNKAAVTIFYITDDGIHYRKNIGATSAIVLASIDGVPGWLSEKGTYGVKLSMSALPGSLESLLST